MTKVLRLVVLAVLGGALAALGATPKVMVLPLTGVIGPASSDFVERGLARAAADGAQLAVLQIDTPGGLDTSMRDIIKAILASPVPVATFVAPSGARAASAGTYILYASHIAAMAPGTNLGAATPINVGMPGSAPSPAPKSGKEPAADKGETPTPGDDAATLARKQVHDAAAYIRGLAQLRGHNAEWGERSVREAVSLSADEALAHPSVALILMMIGVYGLFFEFSNPGFVLPGIVGAIALLLGLFALHMLPVNYAGLALILLGIGFMVAEVFIGSFGALGVGGIIAFVIGAVLLIDTDVPAFGIPWSLIAALTLVTGGFIFFVSGAALKARRRPVVTGSEGLVGSGGLVLDDFAGDGWARVQSEQWRVRSAVPLKRGQSVRVTGRDGLVLTVVPADSPEKGA